MQHISGEYQVEHKQNVVFEQFAHIGQVVPEEILPPLTGNSLGYRNKARLGVKYVNKKARVLVGFREKKKPAFIADIEECLVLNSIIGNRISDLKVLIEQLSINSKIPQLEVAIGDKEAVLVVRHLQDFSQDDINLMESFSACSGIQFYLQPGVATLLQHWMGKSLLICTILLMMRISQSGFHQWILPRLIRKLTR